MEIDANVSADGVVYLHHDDGLERCTNGNGYLVNTTAAELDKLDAGSWHSDAFRGEPLARFTELMLFADQHQLGVNVEIKPTAGWEIPATDAICELLRQWPAHAPLLVSSFSTLSLQRARALLPDVATGLLVAAIPDNWQALMHEYNCQTFHCASDFLDAERLQVFRNADVPVLTYTVNDRQRAEDLKAWGVTSLFSDCPSELGS